MKKQVIKCRVFFYSLHCVLNQTFCKERILPRIPATFSLHFICGFFTCTSKDILKLFTIIYYLIEKILSQTWFCFFLYWQNLNQFLFQKIGFHLKWKHYPDSKTNTLKWIFLMLPEIRVGRRRWEKYKFLKFYLSLFIIVGHDWASLKDFQVKTVKENWVDGPKKGDGWTLNPLPAKYCPSPDFKWGQHAEVS